MLAGKITEKNDKFYIKHSCKDNLSPQQFQTLKTLKNNPNIIIKPADKGGAVVVMNKNLYKQEALRQLGNTDYYRPLPLGPLYPDTADNINNILWEIFKKGHISSRQLGYLKPPIKKMDSRYLYILPKIHKPRKSWPHPFMPAGRPIISDSASESVRICEYIDYFLQPLSTLHPAYLKDTYDFINRIRGQKINPNWYLISADVESLYTNMKIDLILQSVEEIFQEHPHPERDDELILQLLRTILANNDFEFDGKFYLQICGIAMGRKFAPSCANIYLRRFDHAAMTGFRVKPLLYGRFLDDIFGIWPGTLDELMEFETFLNHLIPGIKVKFTARLHILEFLDTQVYKATDDQGHTVLATKVYFKPTDTHQLLHKHSFHPDHTFRGIVKSQFIRFKRISTSKWDFDQACATLIKVLITRRYSHRMLSKIKDYVWRNYDTQTLQHRMPPPFPRPNNQETLPVITYYDKFHSRLNRKWSRLVRDNPKLNSARIISSYRKHKNLRSHLVKGRFGRYVDQGQNLDILLETMERMDKQPLIPTVSV